MTVLGLDFRSSACEGADPACLPDQFLTPVARSQATSGVLKYKQEAVRPVDRTDRARGLAEAACAAALELR
jgi:hypothetical protein